MFENNTLCRRRTNCRRLAYVTHRQKVIGTYQEKGIANAIAKLRVSMSIPPKKSRRSLLRGWLSVCECFSEFNSLIGK